MTALSNYTLVDPMNLVDPADLVDPMDLYRARLSLALERPTETKVMCAAQSRNKWGHVAHTCTVHHGHEGSHRDMHTSGTWRAS